MQIFFSHKTFFVIFFLGLMASVSIFHFDGFAVDDSLKYRQLANGWVSIYAEIHMDSGVTLWEKAKKVVEADIVHGRFRPLFFSYITVPYALSPFVHNRLTSTEERPYRELMNGDLRLFSYILLSTVVLSMLFMALLLYSYTGVVSFSLIPVAFIPLSPSLTENILQNYIDSQEILLVFLVSLWLLLFFSSFDNVRGKLSKKIYFLCSLCFLLFSFLTKESSVVLTGTILTLLLYFFIIRNADDKQPGEKEDQRNLIITFMLSVIMCCLVVVIVKANRHGYANNYVFNLGEIKNAVSKLWHLMSKYTLNNILGFVPIAGSFILLLCNRQQTLNGKKATYHLAVMLTLFVLSYSFLFFLIPWQALMIKYVYPSIFFFSFLVAYSLSIFLLFAKNSGKKMLIFCVYLVFIPYCYLYFSYYEQAEYEKNYWAENANYGVSVLPTVAEDIFNEVSFKEQQQLNVLLRYESGKKWPVNVSFSGVQLRRILNLEKGINMLNEGGGTISLSNMPENELSSFNFIKGNKSVFLSDRWRDAERVQFDLIYMGYLEDEAAPLEITVGGRSYTRSAEEIRYDTFVGLPSFVLYKYKHEV